MTLHQLRLRTEEGRAFDMGNKDVWKLPTRSLNRTGQRSKSHSMNEWIRKHDKDVIREDHFQAIAECCWRER